MALLTFVLLALALDVVLGQVRYAIGDAAMAIAIHMGFRHPPCDPDGPLPTTSRAVTMVALAFTGLALLFLP